VTPALAGAEEILAEIVRSLRALGGWRLEEAAALGPIEALWKIVGITTDNSAEVADFGTDVFVKVIEPLIALLIEARTRDKLPAEGVVAQIRQLAQGPLRRRLSRHDARLVTIQAFERAHAGGWFKRYPAETVAMIATMLEQVFGGGAHLRRYVKPLNKFDRLLFLRIQISLEAMPIVSAGRGHRKKITKWEAIAKVLALFGDEVSASTIRRVASENLSDRSRTN
jgi:hypothetical protein